MSDEMKRELIGSVKLGETKKGKPIANLYSTDKRLEYPILVLFDLSMLEEVGIDPNELGSELVYKRFWAYFIESEKTTSRGNNYRDVQYLEALGAPATTTSTDNTAIVAELRHHTLLLEIIATKLGADLPTVSLGDTDEAVTLDDNRITDPITGGEEQESGESSLTGDTTLDEWFSGNTPTSPRELMQVLDEAQRGFSSVRFLHDTLAGEFGDTWKGWPPADDLDAWSHITKTALQLAEA